MQALPVLWLYYHTAHTTCRDPAHTLNCRALQLQALTHLHMFPEALYLLGEVLAGCGLPQSSCHHDWPVETHSAVKFTGSHPLNDQQNIKVCILWGTPLIRTLKLGHGLTQMACLCT